MNSTPRGLHLLMIALSAATLSGCVLIADIDDDVAPLPPPQALLYEVCYSDFDCAGGRYCEELAVPADRFSDYVNAICTVGCFDDLDCAPSPFTGLPGACIDHVAFAGPVTSRICIERCEFDSDCDLANGFACEFYAGERLCVPVL